MKMGSFSNWLFGSSNAKLINKLDQFIVVEWRMMDGKTKDKIIIDPNQQCIEYNVEQQGYRVWSHNNECI